MEVEDTVVSSTDAGAPSMDDTSHRPARALRVRAHEEVETAWSTDVSDAVARTLTVRPSGGLSVQSVSHPSALRDVS